MTFRQGIAGFTGAHEPYLGQAAPDAVHGAEARVVVDGSPLSQGLVRFEGVVGIDAGQVRPGATVLSAKLSLLTGPLRLVHERVRGALSVASLCARAT